MASQSIFAEIAAVSGDPSRVSVLHALMDGRALTATELARAAGITPQFASSHLARMTAVGLLTVEKQGRHRSMACEPCAWRSQCGDTASLMLTFLAVRLTMPCGAVAVAQHRLHLGQ